MAARPYVPLTTYVVKTTQAMKNSQSRLIELVAGLVQSLPRLGRTGTEVKQAQLRQWSEGT